jgi:hypothetical protein
LCALPLARKGYDDVDPQKFYIGMMELFTVLLPGAVLTVLLMGEVGPLVFGQSGYSALSGAAGWAVFLFSSFGLSI